jgi:hypothetical protein
MILLLHLTSSTDGGSNYNVAENNNSIFWQDIMRMMLVHAFNEYVYDWLQHDLAQGTGDSNFNLVRC